MTHLLDSTGPITTQPLDEPLDGPLDGAPVAGARPLTVLGDVEVGVWEMTPGIAADVEEDEAFVVLSGSATVAFAGSDELLELVAGSVVRLYAGERTTWTVHETLRKVYVS